MSIYDVNGKSPVAVWIPSRDDSGNGTTTLNDLISSNDGTLTDMDAASDWVADTDAGGIRALDFDGSNDRVLIASAVTATLPLSITFWMRPTNNSDRRILSQIQGATTQNGAIRLSSTDLQLWNGSGSVWQTIASGLSLNVWIFASVLYEATQASASINGGAYGTPVAHVATMTSSRLGIGAKFLNTFGSTFLGRIDDMRVFDDEIDTDDISVLYNSGAGRGLITNPPPTFNPAWAINATQVIHD